jgi:hypothetical protein
MFFCAVDINLAEKRYVWLEVIPRPDVTNPVQNLGICTSGFLL